MTRLAADISTRFIQSWRPIKRRHGGSTSTSARGRLGVKTGRGFYDDNDQRVAELTTRLYELARELGD